jgi:hypothetical protein
METADEREQRDPIVAGSRGLFPALADLPVKSAFENCTLNGS